MPNIQDKFVFDVNYAAGSDSVFTLIVPQSNTPLPPPPNNFFLLLDGTNFLLLNGELFRLL
jgi:hypothetical protein